jgi:hypothetical protein
MHESARTDLWEPWGSNPPGRPGPCSLACLDDERRARLRTIRDLEAELAGLLVKTPYMLLLSFPGINVVSAAEFAAEMGPIANSPGDAAITGRAGIYPSRYQSDAVDHSGPLVRRGNRPLRYVILLIAENLLRCNDHFRALGAAWRAAGANRRVAVVRAAKRFCRIAYRMVAGRQVYRHPSCQERHYILAKLSMFYIAHETSLEQVSRDLRAAADWIPPSEHAAEARPLASGLPTAAPAGAPAAAPPDRAARPTNSNGRRKRAASVECDPARGLTPTGGADGRIESVRGDRPHLTAQARGPNNA